MPTIKSASILLVSLAVVFTAGCKDKSEDEKMSGLTPKAGAAQPRTGTPLPPVNTQPVPAASDDDDDDGFAAPDEDEDDEDDETAKPLSAEQAKNHPYAKALVSSMLSGWSPPDGAKGVVTGCIRLNTKGKVVARMVRKTGNPAVETSVKQALDGFAGPGSRIPKALLSTLNGWVCAAFTPPR